MAVICPCSRSLRTPILKQAPVMKSLSKIVMLQRAQVSIKKTTRVLIKTYPEIKQVYEDQSLGVICYTDSKGETICEGFDEGPRYDHHCTRSVVYRSRDVEILDLLQCNLTGIGQLSDTGVASPREPMINWDEFDILS